MLILLLPLTLTQQLGVRRFLEDDDSRAQRGEGHIQTTPAGQRSQFWGEVLQVGPRGTTKKLEHVVVEALCTCTIDHYVRHRQYLEQRRVNGKKKKVIRHR